MNKSNRPKPPAKDMGALRLRAIKAARKAVTVADVARSFDANERSIHRRLARSANGGRRGLKTREPSGRRPKATAGRNAKRRRIVKSKTPQRFKLPYALRTTLILPAA